jgi:membrane protease YdiL (CAAX protease family)
MITRFILVEASLLAVAWILAWLLGIPLSHLWHMDTSGVLMGCSSTLPVISLFFWLAQSRAASCVALRELIQQQLLPHLRGATFLQVLLLSMVAGLAEEVLFRGVIEVGLARSLGPWLAMVLSAILFGLCHALTPVYFLLATGMGLYLSLVWMASGQLISLIITHALYDLIALWWYLRQSQAD